MILTSLGPWGQYMIFKGWGLCPNRSDGGEGFCVLSRFEPVPPPHEPCDSVVDGPGDRWKRDVNYFKAILSALENVSKPLHSISTHHRAHL